VVGRLLALAHLRLNEQQFLPCALAVRIGKTFLIHPLGFNLLLGRKNLNSLGLNIAAHSPPRRVSAFAARNSRSLNCACPLCKLTAHVLQFTPDLNALLERVICCAGSGYDGDWVKHRGKSSGSGNRNQLDKLYHTSRNFSSRNRSGNFCKASFRFRSQTCGRQ
jgi:hypothetical protein